MITYIKGDATSPCGPGNKIIAHICNDAGLWGAGFVLAISRKWEEPEREYRKWSRGWHSVPFELGQVIFVQVEKNIWVANIIGQHGVKPRNGTPPVRYSAIRKGLEKVADFARNKAASVHMPKMGCGLAGGKWSEVEKIIVQIMEHLEVIVYEY